MLVHRLFIFPGSYTSLDEQCCLSSIFEKKKVGKTQAVIMLGWLLVTRRLPLLWETKRITRRKKEIGSSLYFIDRFIHSFNIRLTVIPAGWGDRHNKKPQYDPNREVPFFTLLLAHTAPTHTQRPHTRNGSWFFSWVEVVSANERSTW